MAPFKRGRQPKMTTQALLSMDMDESSSDSDFRIEDHDNVGSDDDYGSDATKEDDDQDDSGDDGNSSSSDEDSDDGDGGGLRDSGDNSTQELRDLLEDDGTHQVNGLGGQLKTMMTQLSSKKENMPKVPTKPICCVCLGDRSDDSNEIIECDGCGVSVHEGCYGVSDNASISSTNSTCSTEPWFCEACRADVTEPMCELCPNKGGIYKETDVGKWVHLVCALYVPGVAFGEVDQLSSVTLFEMQYSKWGAKVCALCENTRFARTGVCIGCDAGMCKTYFHVTCAQAAGFLTEAHHEEADAADPFYAHCKVHSEKEMVKRRKRNFHTFRLNMQQKQQEKQALQLEADPCPAQQRTQRKLNKYRQKYHAHKQLKADPWVPTQKMSRLLTTSASACKRLLAKAAIKSIDVELLERQGAQISSLTDIRKKWHIAPAFTVEFIAYYLDRISRSRELKQDLVEMMQNNGSLTREQDCLRRDYDDKLERNKELKGRHEGLLSAVTELHKTLATLCPSKTLLNASQIGQAVQLEQIKAASTPPSRPISVPTPAALKMGVGFPLAHLGPPGSKVDSNRLLSTHAKHSSGQAATSQPSSGYLMASGEPAVSSAPTTPTPIGVQSFDCGICKRFNDQHLLAKCDTCKLHYHLGCLNPPLTRHPKKSKLYGWQCSECDKSDESDAISDMPKGPRKARTRFNKDGSIAFERPDDGQELEMALGLPPAKRRSTDSVKVAATASSKSKLNKSLPPTGEPAADQKKPKQSQSESEVDEKPLSSFMSPHPMPKGLLPPIQADLSMEKPLHLILSPKTLVQPHESEPVDAAGGGVEHTTSPGDPNNLEANRLARKQKRKEKHKNRHNLSSDNEKSPNKEHKRKRKKKDHDHDSENPNDPGSGVPKIKIKFKTLPLPGEVTPEAHFFYVPADMVCSAEEGSRPTSVETVEESLLPLPVLGGAPQPSPVVDLTALTAVGAKVPPPKMTPSPTKRNSTGSGKGGRKASPRKANPRASLPTAGSPTKARLKTPITMLCSVCSEPGEAPSIVTCDECRKHFHFAKCLEPPLKKTPKIRGYSWHCAECDPTDEDRK